ncbi:hypothetical protein [Zongyangia hominis]|uniref:Uncharacterized protein n=1 Tax=Zongyangia hominis TaxID=2763677 RepID=A0A926ECR6_9FIRM|nr:hypothetical protein [Zongyangia hominis]MBC8571438.1 hypothetical protein [Zongyangia hominis]
MALQPITALSSNVSKTLVCIDRFENTEISGRLNNPYMEHAIPFDGVIDMITKMEKILDAVTFPLSSVRYRSFEDADKIVTTWMPKREVLRYYEDDIFSNKKGMLATFLVQVQYRHNATWQGYVRWLEETKAQNFRSTLELIKLLSDALVSIGETPVPLAGWENAEESARKRA